MTSPALTDRFSQETHDRLWEHELQLLGFAHRLGYVLSIQQELVRVTKGKPFVIYHEPVWNMLLGEREMIIVDLASWAKGFYRVGEGGFLRKLQGDDLRALAWQWQGNDDRNNAWRLAAFNRLFPNGVTSRDGRGPSQQDVDALCDRLAISFEVLRDDRNQHRAHKYEKAQPRTAPMLVPDQVSEHLKACQELLGDIRCLSSNSQFTSYRYKPEAHEDDAYAQDLVDLILCGPISWIVDMCPSEEDRDEQRYYRQRRAAYYERLHDAHGAAGDLQKPFNDRSLVMKP